MQIALALQHMHSKNMVHMDIKPDNIYIVNEVTYKLGDLGLAASSSAHQRGNFEEGDARYLAQFQCKLPSLSHYRMCVMSNCL